MTKLNLLEDQVDTIDDWANVAGCSKYRWIYRGQKKASYNCTFKSSLERLFERMKKYSNLENKDIRVFERAIVSEFKRRFHQFSNYIPKDDHNLKWLSIMRHYGAPTRLLDWTYSFYVALYFALEDADGDAAVYGLRTGWLRDEGVNQLKHHGWDEETIGWLTEKPPFGGVHTAFNKIFLLGNPISTAFPVCPSRMTERLTVQKGTFLCPGDISKSFDANISAMSGYQDKNNVVKYVIPSECRVDFLRELYNMNISRTSLFPGLEGFSQSLNVYHHIYIKENLDDCAYQDTKGEVVWGVM